MAKPQGTTLSGVEWQSEMYATGLPETHRVKASTVAGRLPLLFEDLDTETHFTNGYDPDPRARRIVAFPKPATRARALRDAETDPGHPTWLLATRTESSAQRTARTCCTGCSCLAARRPCGLHVFGRALESTWKPKRGLRLALALRGPSTGQDGVRGLRDRRARTA